ncbi:hypothetical protein ACFCX4_08385 [Kitasatospora sp. NPDC056327]|uniref:hypothetical protein n=1 Tax=Kitasatospora sp. NPDC056327 TaxID=3345785 RepID=UPI0035DC5E45
MSKTTMGVNVDGHAVDAVYELVVGVDVRRSGAYDDPGKTRMRRQLYAVLDRAFDRAGVPLRGVHREDRGDGVLATVAPTVPPSRILGVWVTEVHEQLRQSNIGLTMPLGLRIGLHVGPVTHDAQGVSGHAVDLACRLTDADAARRLLERDRADLVVVVSDSLYREVVRHGGRFVDPEHYAPARLRLKDDEVPAWLRLPGRPRPAPVSDHGEPPSDGPATGEPAGGGTSGGRDTGGGADGGAAGTGGTGRAADPADGDTGPAAGINVAGDFSVHHDNTYTAPVRIGRTIGGGHRG